MEENHSYGWLQKQPFGVRQGERAGRKVPVWEMAVPLGFLSYYYELNCAPPNSYILTLSTLEYDYVWSRAFIEEIKLNGVIKVGHNLI